MGDRFLDNVAGKVVLDFGCGEGAEAVEMAEHGAARVIGIDIRTEVLEIATQNAHAAGVQNCCQFTAEANELVDLIISVDAFEHFADPAAILRSMALLLKPNGHVFISFGPTWYHPLGGHLFSVFPWAHLVFTERALVRWRSTFKTDGATRFSEVAGGLNQMTIARFTKLVEESPFQFTSLEFVPIGPLRRIYNRITREFTTAVVRCELTRFADLR